MRLLKTGLLGHMLVIVIACSCTSTGNKMRVGAEKAGDAPPGARADPGLVCLASVCWPSRLTPEPAGAAAFQPVHPTKAVAQLMEPGARQVDGGIGTMDTDQLVSEYRVAESVHKSEPCFRPKPGTPSVAVVYF